ncbi:hypothetical protein K1719_013196 [Acacia pycnantha]|nr:hypothetical protein K1719_013196 [Acacia pycnantha]
MLVLFRPIYSPLGNSSRGWAVGQYKMRLHSSIGDWPIEIMKMISAHPKENNVQQKRHHQISDDYYVQTNTAFDCTLSHLNFDPKILSSDLSPFLLHISFSFASFSLSASESFSGEVGVSSFDLSYYSRVAS